MNRRTFLRLAGWAATGTCLMGMPGPPLRAEDQAPLGPESPTGPRVEDARFVRPAMFAESIESGRVQCRLCPRECRVDQGQRGVCGVRENRGGRYHTLVYGRAAALNNDPIEKKPFNHVLPGSMVLSTATAGCNIACKFCQNWQISQFRPEEIEARFLPPEELVALAASQGIPSVACTYSEPTIYYEYMFEIARQAKAAGLKAVVISNGFISPAAVRELVPFLAAYKIDLKGFTEEYYRDICSARLAPVLTTLETLKKLGIWFEIVNLVLPTLNDGEKDIRAMARWIKTNLGPMVPLHFTRFQPLYKLRNLPPTPVATLEACHAVARAEGLKYVYIGNVPGAPQGHTYCHQCGQPIIKRTGLWAVESQIKDGRCPYCQTAIPGVWS